MESFDIKKQILNALKCLNAGDIDGAKSFLTAMMQMEFTTNNDTAQLLHAKNELFDNISHNIRTPVNTIIGYVDLLEGSELLPTQKKYLMELRHASDTLEHRVNDLLDITRIGKEKIPLEEISYHVRALFEDIAHQYAASAEKKGIELHLLIHADIPDRLIGDPGRIRQIINQLLDNAIKFTLSGEIILEASANRGTNNQIELQVRITDTGIGMTPEQVQSLCDPLCIPTSKTQSVSDSMHLGVVMYKGLIDQMQSELQIRSMLGSGSAYQFTVVQKTAPHSAEETVPPHDILQGKRIMLVGESKTQQDILRLYLTQADLTVLQADTPVAALRALDKKFEGHLTADVIILDSRLKNANVTSFPEHLKKQIVTNVPPVLLITSVANKGDSKAALESGFSGYITKPVRQQELLDSLCLLFSKVATADEKPQILITRHRVSDIHYAQKDRVLLADDNKSNQKLVQMMLHRLGIDCDIAQSSHETMEALAKHKYQMVLLTNQLSGLDSYNTGNLFPFTQPDQARVPIVAMLSSTSMAERNAFLEKGVNDVLTKPITMQSLQTVITRYMPIKP